MINQELKNFFAKADVCKILESDQQYIVNYSHLGEQDEENLLVNDHTLMIVTSGSLRVITPNYSYDIGEQEAIFVKRGSILARDKVKKNGQFAGVFIFLKDAFVLEFIKKYKHMLNPSEALDVEFWWAYQFAIDSWMKIYFSSLVSYFQVAPPPPPELLSNKINELLLVLIWGQERSYFISFLRGMLNRTKSSIDTVIQSNLYENLSIEHLAFLANKSLSQFKRDFKEQYSDSPGNWIRKKRLERSSHLLLTTDKSINQVCYESGFSNVSHFCQIFQKHYHNSPLKYRKNMIK